MGPRHGARSTWNIRGGAEADGVVPRGFISQTESHQGSGTSRLACPAGATRSPSRRSAGLLGNARRGPATRGTPPGAEPMDLVPGSSSAQTKSHQGSGISRLVSLREGPQPALAARSRPLGERSAVTRHTGNIRAPRNQSPRAWGVSSPRPRRTRDRAPRSWLLRRGPQPAPSYRSRLLVERRQQRRHTWKPGEARSRWTGSRGLRSPADGWPRVVAILHGGRPTR